jgi:tetratricopeptide (TPR) repeat protein
VAEHLLGIAQLDDEIRARIVDAADGNPLFVEQLLSMMIDDGLIVFEDGAWRPARAIDTVAVPPTIHALLSARIDGLGPNDRAVLEPAAVIGQIFVRDAVRHLTPEGVRPELDAHLGSLTEKKMVERDRGRSDEDAFRFQHILIRDTAYDGILKRARATHHEAFVRWADSVNREGATEYEEILGYHLEQAYRYLSELGPLDDHGREIGADGARRLAAAGRRAFARGDAPAAANLLGRAAALLPDDDAVRLLLLAEYGEALLQAGRFDEATAAVAEVVDRGSESGGSRASARAALVGLLVRLRTSQDEGWRDEAGVTITEAMAVFEETGDASGLAMAWRLLAWAHGTACHFGLAAEASQRALEHAEQAGDARQRARAATAYAAAAVLGPTPVDEALERCELALAQVRGDRQSEGVLLSLMASMTAMSGSFVRARDLVRQAQLMMEELGLDVEMAGVGLEAWRVEMLAGDAASAERLLRRSYDLLVELGERYFRSTVAGLLGQTLYALERYDEVEALGLEARELSTEDDIGTQALWRCVLGKMTALTGASEEGEALVREALAILGPTDALHLRYGALLDLADIQNRSGADATQTLAEALELARAKRNSVMVDAITELASAARPVGA